MMSIGLVLLSLAPVDATYVVNVLPALTIMGMGAGLVFMPSVLLAMSGVDTHDAGLASGVANVAIQMGAAIGVAILASISSSDTTNLLARGASLDSALTSGYHLGFVVAAGVVTVAAIVAAVVLQSARAANAPERSEHIASAIAEAAA
jgi:hypothetical protein